MTKSLVLDRFFHTLTSVLVAIGFSMLVMAEQISLPVFWLFTIPFCLSFSRRVTQHFQLTLRQANLITWLYIPLFLVDTFFLSKSFVPGTIHLILFVQLVKIYQPKGSRDYFYLIVLSFLEVLASSSLTISIAFFIFFVLFLLVSIAALICFELRRASDSWSAQDQSRTLSPDSPSEQRRGALGLSEQEEAIRAILAASVVSLLGTSLLGTALFFAVPRFGSGYLSRTVGKSLRLSGFSDRIRLGSIGSIQLDPTVVMRVKINGDPKLSEELRWRGITLDHFDGRNWSKHIKGAAHSFPPGQSFKIRERQKVGAVTKYQILLEACSTPYLFTLDRILSIRGNLDSLIYDPVDDSVLARPHDFYRLIYQGDSVLPEVALPATQGAELPFETTQAYLQMPSLDKRILELAASIAKSVPSSEEKARRLEDYLRTHYRYSLSASQIENPEPLAAFLFETQKGHCEYFASAMVVMLRAVGIPSRIVNGFRAGEYNDVGSNYIIRGKDAHSWVEAYIFEKGWQPYDPTPASTELLFQNPLSLQISHYLDAFELFWGEWILGYDEITQVSLFRDLQERLAQWVDYNRRQLYRGALKVQLGLVWVQREFAVFIGRSKWKLLLSSVFLAVGGWLAIRLLQRLGRTRRLNGAIRRGDGTLATQLYGDMLEFFRSKGKLKPAGLTPTEFIETFANRRVREQVEQLTQIYNLLRFSKSVINLEQIQRAYSVLAEIKNLSREGET
jgi:hypothetical protein